MINRALGIKIIIAGLLYLFTSCEKIIEQPPTEFQIIDNIDEIEKSINSAYSTMAKALSYYTYLTVKSDDIILMEKFLTFRPGRLPTVAPTNFYRYSFLSILMSNKIIGNYQNLEQPDPEFDQYVGEAYFLRAYNLFKLTRVFGKIPLVTDLEVNYNTKRASYTEIYSQIVNDLQTAQDFLPDTYFTARVPSRTPHDGLCEALLAEVYLTMGGFPLYAEDGYEKALKTSKAVIDNAEFYGFILMEDFAELWNWDTHINSEAHWLIYFNDDNFYPSDGKDLEAWTYILRPEHTFFHDYPLNYRKHITFWMYHYEEDYFLVDSIHFTYETWNYTYPRIADFQTYVIAKKHIVNIPASNPHSEFFPVEDIYGSSYDYWYHNAFHNIIETDSNSIQLVRDEFTQYFHLHRYSQTLLTFAEAKARAGGIDKEAYEAINIIRRRANKAPLYLSSAYDLEEGLSNAQFADSVVAERA